MISALRGKVIFQEGRSLTLDVSGVGYDLYCSRSSIEQLEPGKESSFVIYTDVKEDSITLFAFRDNLEKRVFLLLKQVKGIGSRIASDILSQMDKLDLLRAIGSGDTAKLQSARGVGRKLAERVVVELKEKVAQHLLENRSSNLNIEVSTSNAPISDALEALKALGFAHADADRALKAASSELAGAPTDSADLIRRSLKYV